MAKAAAPITHGEAHHAGAQEGNSRRLQGLFQVDVVTAPPGGGDFSAFNPDFSKYRVIVMNYDAPDERWPDSLKASFEAYVRTAAAALGDGTRRG